MTKYEILIFKVGTFFAYKILKNKSRIMLFLQKLWTTKNGHIMLWNKIIPNKVKIYWLLIKNM